MDVENYDFAVKLPPLFHHLMQHFQDVLQAKSHQSIDEHIQREFKEKSLMHQYMKNKLIK